MLRLASDENIHGGLVQALRGGGLDIVRVQDVGLDHTPDPLILDWAAAQGRIVITVDLNTMIGFAWDRVARAQPMPGLLVLRENSSMGAIIDEILLIAACYSAAEMASHAVIYVPM
jgi:predicted nuclease of predicted toxin-antitoxin system